MLNLLLYTSGVLVLKGFFRDLLKFLGVRVLNSRIVLKIYYKLSLVYFDTKKIAQVDSGLKGLLIGPKKRLGKGFERVEDFASLFSTLEFIKLSFESFDRFIKSWFLQKWSQLQEKSMIMAKTCVKV